MDKFPPFLVTADVVLSILYSGGRNLGFLVLESTG